MLSEWEKVNCYISEKQGKGKGEKGDGGPMLDTIIGFIKNLANSGFAIDLAGIVLQYMLLLLVYYFLFFTLW